MKIAVCVPSRDHVHAGFANDLAQLIGYSAVNIDHDLHLMFNRGTLLCSQREMLVENAMEWGADKILWLDSDMRFPKILLEAWLDHGKDVVAANCARRVRPSAMTAVGLPPAMQDVWTEEDDEGLEEVAVIGLAVMLVSTEVYEAAEQPWHQTPWHKGRHVGEDTYFCSKARSAGYQIWIDHDMSKLIGHTGEHVFTYGDALHDREISDPILRKVG